MNDTVLNEREVLALRNIVIDQYDLREGELPFVPPDDSLTIEEFRALSAKLGLPYALPPLPPGTQTVFSEAEWRADPSAVVRAAEVSGYARVVGDDGRTICGISLGGRLRR